MLLRLVLVLLLSLVSSTAGAKAREDPAACEGTRRLAALGAPPRRYHSPLAAPSPPPTPFPPRCASVCISVIGQIDAGLSREEREDVEKTEKAMRKWCDSAKGKDKTMCYYMGVGDEKEGTSGGVKRDISSALGRGINAKRLCNRLKTKDGQMCELKYEKKFDPKAADFGKVRARPLGLTPGAFASRRAGLPPQSLPRLHLPPDPTCSLVAAQMRVKEMRRICDDAGIDTKGLVEKDEFVRKIKAHYNIKDEV